MSNGFSEDTDGNQHYMIGGLSISNVCKNSPLTRLAIHLLCRPMYFTFAIENGSSFIFLPTYMPKDYEFNEKLYDDYYVGGYYKMGLMAVRFDYNYDTATLRVSEDFEKHHKQQSQGHYDD